MIKGKKVKQYKEATFMNIVRKRTFDRYPEAHITYGSITSLDRKILGLTKTHYNDAVAITGINYIKELHGDYFYYKQFRKKKRSLQESIPRKGKKQKNINSIRNNKNVKSRHGIYLNDKLEFENKIGWVYGFSSGEHSYECVLKDSEENIIRMPTRTNSLSVNTKQCKLVCHNNGWQYSISRKEI